MISIITTRNYVKDRLCDVVARVLVRRPGSPGFDYRCYHIFRVAVALGLGPLSLVRINEELLERKSSGSDIEN
jgi:hypothetical protein